MVDDRPDDVLPHDPSRAKRSPSTLDLSANEAPHADASAASDDAPPCRRAGWAAGALTGAIAGALVAAASWYATSAWQSTQEPTTLAASVDTAKVDELSARVAKLEGRAPPAIPAAPDLSAITARLDALEISGRGLHAELQQTFAVANEAKSEAASKLAPAAAVSAPVDLTDINARLAQLEAATKAQSEQLAAPPAKPVDQTATRRIAAAALLDAQVRQGEPYAGALAAAKSLAPDPGKLAPLDAFATTGVPDAAALSRALLEMPQFKPQPPTATSGGVIDRLRSGAAKLVSIERIDAPASSNAVFTRAADAAKRDDVATASRELAALALAERAPFQPWLDRVAARDAARAAARQFAEDALALLPKP